MYQEQLLTLNKKIQLLEIAERLDKISCVSDEFNILITDTKKSIVDLIRQLDSPSESDESCFVKIKGSAINLQTLEEDLKQFFPSLKPISISDGSDSFMLMAFPQSQEINIKQLIEYGHDVEVNNITKDQFSQLNQQKPELVYLKVSSRNHDLNELKFLHNDLDLLHRNFIKMHLNSETLPFLLLCFDKSKETEIRGSLYAYTITNLTKDSYEIYLYRTLNTIIYVKICATTTKDSFDMKAALQSFVDFWNEKTNSGVVRKIIKKFNLSMPYLLLTTDKTNMTNIVNSIFQRGLSYKQIEKDEYKFSKN